jgi:hypothetical protein
VLGRVPRWWRHEGGTKDVGGRVAGFVLQYKVEWSGAMALCGSCRCPTPTDRNCLYERVEFGAC